VYCCIYTYFRRDIPYPYSCCVSCSISLGFLSPPGVHCFLKTILAICRWRHFLPTAKHPHDLTFCHLPAFVCGCDVRTRRYRVACFLQRSGDASRGAWRLSPSITFLGLLRASVLPACCCHYYTVLAWLHSASSRPSSPAPCLAWRCLRVLCEHLRCAFSTCAQRRICW